MQQLQQATATYGGG